MKRLIKWFTSYREYTNAELRETYAGFGSVGVGSYFVTADNHIQVFIPRLNRVFSV